MNKLKKSIQKHALNQEEIYQSLNVKREKPFFKKFLISTAVLATLVMDVMIGPLLNEPIQEKTDHVVGAIAYYQLEINPHFDIVVDEDGLVVDIHALNEDAKTFKLNRYKNKAVEEVIEQLIVISSEKGYIDVTDEAEDFIIVSSVVIDEENEEDKIIVDSIGARIRARIESSGELDPKTNVIYIKATIAEKIEAEGKEIPLGLYIIREMINSNGEMIPISQYVKNENALKKKEQAGISITKGNHNSSKVKNNEPQNKSDANKNENVTKDENKNPQNNLNDNKEENAINDENEDPENNSNDNQNKEGTENSNRS